MVTQMIPEDELKRGKELEKIAGYTKWILSSHIPGKVYDLSQQNMNAMIKDIERLIKILAQELSENDELGAEYTYVIALKLQLSSARKVIEYCSKDDPLAVDQEHKYDFSSADHWKQLQARAWLEENK